MKNKKKKIIIIAIILIILLFPIRESLKDGGSVVYKSLTYEVTKLHQLPMESDGPYIEGYRVEIFGITVYEKTNE